MVEMYPILPEWIVYWNSVLLWIYSFPNRLLVVAVNYLSIYNKLQLRCSPLCICWLQYSHINIFKDTLLDFGQLALLLFYFFFSYFFLLFFQLKSSSHLLFGFLSLIVLNHSSLQYLLKF